MWQPHKTWLMHTDVSDYYCYDWNRMLVWRLMIAVHEYEYDGNGNVPCACSFVADKFVEVWYCIVASTVFWASTFVSWGFVDLRMTQSAHWWLSLLPTKARILPRRTSNNLPISCLDWYHSSSSFGWDYYRDRRTIYGNYYRGRWTIYNIKDVYTTNPHLLQSISVTTCCSCGCCRSLSFIQYEVLHIFIVSKAAWRKMFEARLYPYCSYRTVLVT